MQTSAPSVGEDAIAAKFAALARKWKAERVSAFVDRPAIDASCLPANHWNGRCRSPADSARAGIERRSLVLGVERNHRGGPGPRIQPGCHARNGQSLARLGSPAWISMKLGSELLAGSLIWPRQHTSRKATRLSTTIVLRGRQARTTGDGILRRVTFGRPGSIGMIELKRRFKYSSYSVTSDARSSTPWRNPWREALQK